MDQLLSCQNAVLPHCPVGLKCPRPQSLLHTMWSHYDRSGALVTACTLKYLCTYIDLASSLMCNT